MLYKKKYYIIVFIWIRAIIFPNSTCFALFSYRPFSVSPNKHVYFSPGNLQYNAMLNTHKCADGKIKKGTWSFANHQWEYVGNDKYGNVYYKDVKCDNQQKAGDYEGWIDLFGWGTSGYDNTGNDPYAINYEAWCTDTNTNFTSPYNSHGYGPSTNTRTPHITASYYDWGIYNTIFNGDIVYAPSTWRTLSYEEYTYILKRKDDKGRYLHGVGALYLNNGDTLAGLILLPDDWKPMDDVNFIDASDNQNNELLNFYTLSEWDLLEARGAVFLPMVQLDTNRTNPFVIFPKKEKNLPDCNLTAVSWTGTMYNENFASFMATTTNEQNRTHRYMGLPVRLVCDINNAPFNIKLIFDTICQGEPYNWKKNVPTQPGKFIDSDTFTINDGFDSITLLYLTILSGYIHHDTVIICKDSSYLWHGNLYKKSGIYTDSSRSTLGCDSLSVLHLSVNTTSHQTIYDTIYSDQTYTWNNHIFTETGVYIYHLTPTAHCDSVITLFLYVKKRPQQTDITSISPAPKNIITESVVHANMQNTITVPKETTMQLYNTTGTLLWSKVLSKGKNTYHTPIATGIYFIRFISDTNTRTVKIIVR